MDRKHYITDYFLYCVIVVYKYCVHVCSCSVVPLFFLIIVIYLPTTTRESRGISRRPIWGVPGPLEPAGLVCHWIVSERGITHDRVGYINHRCYTSCTGIGNVVRRSIYAIEKKSLIRVALSLATWIDLASFVASLKLMQTQQDENGQSLTVLNCVVFS